MTFITTLFGWTLLKRAGASAMIKLRATLDGRVTPGSRHFLDETLATVGALALLMPGFLSDLVGLFLAVPSARDRVSLWIGKRGWIAKGGLSGLQPSDTRARPSPSSIDLDPDDWRRTDGPQRPITKS